jgi:transcriptional regulator GlxA family with amidase domain
VRKVYPNVKTLITVCTGAVIAASAGVLDGKSATTNKRAWAFATAKGPKTNWIAKARWVVDGNVWTSAGISAGIDIALSWVASVWGQEVAEGLATGMEYEWHKDASWDPFSEVYGLEDVINDPALEKRRRESERNRL